MPTRKRPPNSKNPEKSVFLLFHQAQQKMDTEQNKLLNKYKITPRQFIILQTIDYHPMTNQNEIQKCTKIDRTTISEIIKKLEDKNLISCRFNTNDRRYKEIKGGSYLGSYRLFFWSGFCNCGVQKINIYWLLIEQSFSRLIRKTQHIVSSTKDNTTWSKFQLPVKYFFP